MLSAVVYGRLRERFEGVVCERIRSSVSLEGIVVEVQERHAIISITSLRWQLT